MKEFKLFAIFLQIAFIVLKLNHTVDWSWWVVALPIILIIALRFLCFMFGVCLALYLERKRKKEWAKYGASTALDYRVKKMIAEREKIAEARRKAQTKG